MIGWMIGLGAVGCRVQRVVGGFRLGIWMTTGFRCMMIDSGWAAFQRPGPTKRMMAKRLSKKNDGETAVKSVFNSSKGSMWFPVHRDRDAGCEKMQMFAPSETENADVCSQRNSASQSCSARLSLIRLAIRKIGRGSDFAKIDARWRKRDSREFRLRLGRLLTRPLLGAPSGGPSRRSSLRRYDEREGAQAYG